MVSLRQAVTLDAMVSKSRLRRIVTARHIAMWVARKRGYSTTLIGLEFGDRDHTSVIHATRKIDRRIAGDDAFAARMAALADAAPTPPEERP
jgi:chromosomal replication initiator protein